MFTRKLLNADPSKATTTLDPAAPQYRLGDYGYGKEGVRVFQLKKDGPTHSIMEFKVYSHLRLRSHKEYYEGDNSEMIGSDVQETNIYMHAKKYGLSSPEDFALTLTQHFLDTYALVAESNLIVEDVAWDRLGEQEKQGYYKGKQHNHAFMRNTNGQRYCEVVRTRDGPPLLIVGLRGLRILKTARAPFTGYVKGSLYTEGDQPDRVLCTELSAKWQYSTVDGIDFVNQWYKVREILLHVFFGHPVEGVTIPSVQFAAYMMGRAVLDALPEICSFSISLPNYQHFSFDFSRFPAFETETDVQICKPVEEPSGVGYAQLDRNTMENVK